MAGTRTAPTLGLGSETTIGLTMHLIDASGDVTTEYLEAEVYDLVNFEAFAAAYQAATNTSLWKVTVSSEFEGEADPQNAQAVFRAAVQNGINLLFKDIAASQSADQRIIAPVSTIMQGNQDIPLISAAPAPALLTQYLTVLGGAFALDSAQYTGRRDRRNNPRIRI